MVRGAWQATVHGRKELDMSEVTEHNSWLRLFILLLKLTQIVHLSFICSFTHIFSNILLNDFFFCARHRTNHI